MRGYLPTYLKDVGWTPALADIALAATSGASILGVFPIAFLSHRFGSRKMIMFATVLMTTIGVGLLSIAEGFMIWVSVIIAGIAFDGYMAILHTMVMESEGVSVEHTGTAIGLVHTVGRLGNVGAPPIGNSLATINPSLAFIFWSALAVIPLVSFISFVKETSWKSE
jgi:MFS family permease